MLDLLLALQKLMEGLSSGIDPRLIMMRSMFDLLFNQKLPDLNTQNYLDLAGPFLYIASAALFLEMFYRLFRMFRGSDISQQIGQWCFSATFLLILTGVLPGILLGSQAALSGLARWIAASFAGSNDPNALYEALKPLTGGPEDFWLGAIQMVFMMVILLAVAVIPLIAFVSDFMLILGVGLRWTGDFGASLLRLSLTIAFYAISASSVYVLTFAVTSAAASAITKDPGYRGLLNTAIFIIAASVTYMFMKVTKDKLKAVVSGAVSTVSKTSAAVQSGFNHISDAKDQVKEAMTARRSRSHPGTGAARGNKFKTSPASTSTPTGEEVMTNERRQDADQTAISSAASRSRTRLTAAQPGSSRKMDIAKLGLAAATAYRTKSPAAIKQTVEAARKVVAKQPAPEKPKTPELAPTTESTPSTASPRPAVAPTGVTSRASTARPRSGPPVVAPPQPVSRPTVAAPRPAPVPPPQPTVPPSTRANATRPRPPADPPTSSRRRA